jgi:hydroxymethylpyrimidine/phosphomethylpyrimidine kinase
LSSAIASNLALGMNMKESVFKAKRYVNLAIKAGLNLGHGPGPLMHHYR